MPVIEITESDIAPENAELCGIKIYAVMLHPKDQIARQRLLDAIEAASIRDQAERTGATGVIVPPHLLNVGNADELLSAAMASVTRGSEKAPDAPQMTGGRVAGNLLALVLMHKDELGSKSTLGLAISKLSDNLKKHNAKNAREKDLNDYWVKWRSVSHLWGALIILEDNTKYINAPTSLQIRMLLAMAEELRRQAETHRSDHSSRTLLVPGECWTVPGEISLPAIRFR